MSKLGYVCSLVLVIAAIGCGDDDGGSGAGGGAGVGGGTLCEQQLNRARNECMVPEQLLGFLAAGGANDAGVATCEGAQLCVANCAQTSSCADLTSLTSPFISCAVGCQQQAQP